MKKITILLLLCAYSYIANSQFQTSGVIGPPAVAYRFGETQITVPLQNNIRAIGIGNFNTLGGGVTPQARLHVNSFFFPATNAATAFIPGELFRTDGPSNVPNTWRLFTGATAATSTEKGMIFNYGNNPTVADQTNFSLQASVRDMSFYTLPITTNTVGTERMRVVGVNRVSGALNLPVRAGNVGIQTHNPLAKLHIGFDAFSFVGMGASGYRNWMDIGVLMYGSQTGYNPTEGSDNMYVGLWQLGPDQADAIINWGNNPTGGAGVDRLRFVFTASIAAGLNASSPNGLETARIITDGNIGMMGIGGDATFNPYSTGADPGNTLEVNSPGLTNALGGSSGLRFTNLTNASPTTPNTGNMGVLSVNLQGDVVYVPGGTGGTIGDNGLSLDGPTLGNIHLGQSVGTVGDPAQLLDDREIPMNSKNIIFSGTPETFPGKVGFGIVGGINNVNPLSLRSTPITMQVNGSISLFDGSGDASLFFGEEQFAYNSGTLGEWGIQYWNNGLNFWRPSGSGGYGFGNKFLFLSDNGNVGIGATSTAAPANALEITSYPTSPQPAGLRFTNLLSTSTPSSFSALNYLSVDNNGDVILVPGGFGAACSLAPATQYDLTDNWRVGFANNNLFFDGQGATNTNSIGIGYNCQNLPAKLSVMQDLIAGGQIGIDVVNHNYGLPAIGSNPEIPAIGIQSLVDGHYPNPNLHYTNFAGKFTAKNGETNIAGNFDANTGDKNYGIWAKAPAGSVQPYPNPPLGNNFAGFFDGDVARTGNDNFMSDINMKENIYSISNALDKIMRLNPSNFTFRTTQYPQISLPNGIQFGLIAQNVDTVIPELVRNIIYPAIYDSIGNIIYPEMTFKGLNYIGLIPIVIRGIQELDSAVTVLQDKPSGVSGNGTANYITKWQDADSLTISQIFDDGTNVGIGTTSGSAKLSVATNASPIALSAGTNYSDPSATTYGVMTGANGQNSVNIGTYSSAASASSNIGVYTTSGLGGIENTFNTGILSQVRGGSYNYGLYTTVSGSFSAPSVNYGIFATINSLFPGSTDYAGFFDGDVYSSGTYLGSDIMLKDNVTPFTNAISIIDQLQPKTFTFKTAQYPQMNLPTGSQFGLVAQDVEPILPNMVKEVIQPAVKDTAGNIITPAVTFKSIKYEPFIPILIQGMKEEHSTIDSMKTQIADLQNQVALLLGNNGGNAKILNTINVELANDAVLYQNIPNPFAEETMINYYIPENTGNAKIIFIDMYGQSMKEVPLTETGSGNIHVDSKNLASGIYSYSLIIDGKVIDTKKMVRNK